MSLAGVLTLSSGPLCSLSEAQSFPVTIVEDPGRVSLGQIVPQSADASFPADSSVDVFFLLITPHGVIEGGPPGSAPGPVSFQNVIQTIPPYQSPGADAPNVGCYNGGSDA